jgi:polyhydroxybutyrate depolymerase
MKGLPSRSLRHAGLSLIAVLVGLALSACGASATTTTATATVSAAAQAAPGATPTSTPAATTTQRAAASTHSATAAAPSTTTYGSGPTQHTFSLTSGGHTRTYILQVPAQSHGAMGLMIVLHGADDTASHTVGDTDYAQVGAADDDLVAYPQGYEDTWNEGAGGTPARQAGINDVAFIGAMIKQIKSRYPVNAKQVAAAGFSNGALMVQYLGCQLASAIDLIQPIEGQLPVTVAPACHPSRPVSVDEIHGTADTSIPYAGGRFYGVGGGTTVLSATASVAKWAGLDRCSSRPSSHTAAGRKTTSYSGCRSGAQVQLLTIDGGTHQFPDDAGQLLASAMKRLP